jgi:hypothetical protein
MVRAAVVDGGVVLNVVKVADLSWQPPVGTLVPTDTAGLGWAYVDGEFVAPPAPPEPPVTVQEQREARAYRYQTETDPLFFKAQRGEDGVTFADWQAAVNQIRADLPYSI